MRTMMGAAAIVLGMSAPVVAQGPPRIIDPANGLSIEQAIAEALRAEPALGAARAEAEAMRGEQRQAAARPNPEVMFEQREQVGGMDRQTSLTMELPLDLFRRGPRMIAAAGAADAAQAATAERERQVAILVREQYGRVIGAARRLEIADAVLIASQRTYDLLRARVEQGAAPPLERDTALLDLRRMEGERAVAAGRIVMEATGMNRLLGRAADAPLSLRIPLEAAAISDAAMVTNTPVAERADIREAMATAAMAEARVGEAQQEQKPAFSLFGGYMRMDAGFDQLGLSTDGTLAPIQGRFHNIAAGVRMSIPLINRNTGSIAAARARQIAAQDLVRARRLDASADVVAAAARVTAARRALEAYSPDVRALAARNLDVLRETYALGRATLFDVLNEQRRYLEFESSYADVLSELFAATTALRGATGELR